MTDPSSKRVLVTGSSGFIGSHLVPFLAEAGFAVTGVDREEPTGGDGLERFIHADVRDLDRVRPALEEVDTVVHLAAARGDWGIEPAEYFEENVSVTRELLEMGASAGIDRWIFYSSVSAIGPSVEGADEEAPLNPRGPYGRSKAEAEGLFRALCRDRPESRVLLLRPSVVFGPGNPPDTNIFRLVSAILGRRFVMVGDGSTLKSTSYIENLLAAHLFLMERMESGVQTYIYVDDPVMTTGEIVRVLYRELGKSPPRWRLPYEPTRTLAGALDWIGDRLHVDLPITRARIEKFCRGTNFDGSKIRTLGFGQPVENHEALRRTVAWHRATVEV